MPKVNTSLSSFAEAPIKSPPLFVWDWLLLHNLLPTGYLHPCELDKDTMANAGRIWGQEAGFAQVWVFGEWGYFLKLDPPPPFAKAAITDDGWGWGVVGMFKEDSNSPLFLHQKPVPHDSGGTGAPPSISAPCWCAVLWHRTDPRGSHQLQPPAAAPGRQWSGVPDSLPLQEYQGGQFQFFSQAINLFMALLWKRALAWKGVLVYQEGGQRLPSPCTC